MATGGRAEVAATEAQRAKHASQEPGIEQVILVAGVSAQISARAAHSPKPAARMAASKASSCRYTISCRSRDLDGGPARRSVWDGEIKAEAERAVDDFLDEHRKQEPDPPKEV